MTVRLGMLCDRIRPDERMIIEAAKSKGVNLNVHNVDELVFDTARDPRPKLEELVNSL